MKLLAASLVAFGALALAPAVFALSASMTVRPASVASGTPRDVKACVATSGDPRLPDREGPDTFAQDITFRPAPAVLVLCRSTPPAGPPASIGSTASSSPRKGAKRIDSVTLTVT
jgi:hypothetical protein